MSNYSGPDEFRPLSPWAYFGLEILYSIPIVGFIILVIHALAAGNVNKKNFARSYFCFLIIVLIVIGIIVLATGGLAGLAALGSHS